MTTKTPTPELIPCRCGSKGTRGCGMAAALADHHPTTNPVDDSETPIGDHQTPPDWAIAEALRLFGYRADAGSIRLLRQHGDGFAMQGRIVLAHAATLHKLAVAREALQAVDRHDKSRFPGVDHEKHRRASWRGTIRAVRNALAQIT